MKYVKIIYGTEAYLMETAKAEYLAACTADCGGEPEQSVFQKDDLPENVAEALEGTSLFEAATVTVWNDPVCLPIKRGGRSKSKIDKKEEWFLKKVQSLKRGAYLLCIIHGAADVNNAFFKALRPFADISVCEAVTEKNVMPYVEVFLQRRGLSLDVAARGQLQEMFHAWGDISLLYIFSELEKLVITCPAGTRLGRDDVAGLFAGSAEKNLYTFTDFFLARDGSGCVPFISSLFGKPDVFLQSTGYVLSRLSLLRAYMELTAARTDKAEADKLLTAVNKGRPARNSVYYLQKVVKYWKTAEIDQLIYRIFELQLRMRRGEASMEDMESLICLFCATE